MPFEAAVGPATVEIVNNGQTLTVSGVQINPVGGLIFTLGAGLERRPVEEEHGEEEDHEKEDAVKEEGCEEELSFARSRIETAA